jgi:hypothetical protein
LGGKATMKLRNNIAAFGWGICFLFLAMCSAFTYILFRDGSSSIQIYPPDNPGFYPSWFMPVVLAVFWVFGLGFASYFTKKPCVQVEVSPNKSVSIIKRFPFRKEAQIFQASELSTAQVVEEEDGDGDPYFTVAVTHVGGNSIVIAEGHVRQACEEMASRFNAAIGKVAV